jgi:cytoskeletal protein CcmA (bactofilin family)
MKTRRLTRLLPALAVAMFVMVLSAAPVLAFDSRAGDLVTVGGEEEVQGDLYLGGRAITTTGIVHGSVFAAGQTVSIAGTIDDGATLGGQTVTLSGRIGRGVRVGASTVDATGDIEGDLVAGCGTLTVADGARVGEDLVFGAGKVYVLGEVEGDIKGGAETLVIAGRVGGDVEVKVGTLEVKPGAVIEGNLSYTAGTESDIPAGAVKGTIAFTERIEEEDTREVRRGLGALGPFFLLAGIIWKIVAYLMALVTGIVLILLLPGRMAGASDAIRTQTGASAGWGAIALFVTPIAAIVVCITIVGLPIGLISLALWGILLYLSQLPVGLLIGHLILGHSKPLEGRGFMIGSLALGLLLLTLLRAIPLLGFFVWLTIALFGMGAFVVVEKRTIEARRSRGDRGQS